MQTKFIEATGVINHGKFMIGRFDDEEAARGSAVDVGIPLLARCGWGDGAGYLLVWDLQTGEGAIFRKGGCARADLDKHRVWVCPLFEPFLEWLYQQDTTDLEALPALVHLPDAPGDLAGYRRPGI